MSKRSLKRKKSKKKRSESFRQSSTRTDVLSVDELARQATLPISSSYVERSTFTTEKMIYSDQRGFDFVTADDGIVKDLKLIRSHRDQGWNVHCRGELAMSLTDDGNGYRVCFGDKSFTLGYDEAEYLAILLTEVRKLSNEGPLDYDIFTKE